MKMFSHWFHYQISIFFVFPEFFNRELKYLDVTGFLPTKNLKSSQVVCLCQKIFEHGVKIKPELRKGVWMHLVGVFHPGLRSREEREQYIGKLRMVYDHLKGTCSVIYPYAIELHHAHTAHWKE